MVNCKTAPNMVRATARMLTTSQLDQPLCLMPRSVSITTRASMRSCLIASSLVPPLRNSFACLACLHFVDAAVDVSYDFALFEPDHAPAHGVDDWLIVCGNENGRASLIDSLEQLHDLERRLRIQISRRF